MTDLLGQTQDAGLTIVELMISVLLASILIAGLFFKTDEFSSNSPACSNAPDSSNNSNW